MSFKMSVDRSTPPMVTVRPSSLAAPDASWATTGPVPKTASTSARESRAALMSACCLPDASPDVVITSNLPLKVLLAPSQRASRPVLVCSCLTQRRLFAPAAVNFSPAPAPAVNSSCPMWVNAPNSL